MVDVRHFRNMLTISLKAFGPNEDGVYADAGNLIRSFRGTYGNLLACLKWPLVGDEHTIQHRFYYNGEHSKVMEDYSTLDVLRPVRDDPESKERWSFILSMPSHYLNKLSQQTLDKKLHWKPDHKKYLKGQSHVLVFQTSVVQLYIGEPLTSRVSHSDDEVGVFTLVTSRDETVGEITTTYRRAKVRGSKWRQDFIHVSWGFALDAAQPHPRYTPRWRFDGDAVRLRKAGKSEEIDDVLRTAGQHLLGSTVSPLSLLDTTLKRLNAFVPGGWLPIPDAETSKVNDPTLELFKTLFEAEKGELLPRELWPVLNVLLVDWDGKVANRAGVGKIMKVAWQERKSPLTEVVLG